MIYRKLPDGQAMVLTQTDHSRLAGFLAAHWGNESFAQLQPYESVTRAATFHDFGWLRYETQPEIDPALDQARPCPRPGDHHRELALPHEIFCLAV